MADFLKQRSVAAARRELKSIVDSYHHYWDTLAELIQNARDALIRKSEAGGGGPYHIHVEVDAAKRSITVLDTGVGISHRRMTDVLAPGGGDKENKATEVGEKGVGLTYAVFSSDRFAIESRVADEESHAGEVKGARTWLNGSEEHLTPEYAGVSTLGLSSRLNGGSLPPEVLAATSYTCITVEQIAPGDNETDLFSLTPDQLRFLLRTRTAIGATAALFGRTPSIVFTASYRFLMGSDAISGEVEAEYPVPHKYFEKESVALSAVNEAFVTRSKVEQRTKYLKGRTVWHMQADNDIRVYAVMYPRNSAFERIAQTLNLRASDGQAFDGSGLFESAIVFSTKGMPTGLNITQPAGGRYPAYYRRCLFVVEWDAVRFDLGRKSLHWKHEKRIKSAVAAVFAKLESVAQHQSDERVEPGVGGLPRLTKAEREAESKARWTRLLGLVDLSDPRIPFQKTPDRQEAAVAAIFHELLGAKVLTGYRPIATGYSHRYDMHCLYDEGSGTPLQLIVEFKVDLASIVSDLEDATKRFDDVHLLVAWTADKQKLKDAQFDLRVVSTSQYTGATHELDTNITGMDAIPVILLEDLITRHLAS